MATAIHFSDRYLADLDRAVSNYWLISQRAAAQFAEDHDRKVILLGESPGLGERRGGSRMSSPIGKSGYRIVYRITNGDSITLLRLENVRRLRR